MENNMARIEERKDHMANYQMIDLYQKIQSSSAIHTSLPEEIGEGSITQIKTNCGTSFSSWKMKYDRNTFVEGNSGKHVRIMFCHGAGVEWSTDCGIKKLNQGEASLCVCSNENESMCYVKNDKYSFDSLCIPRDVITGMLYGYIPDPSNVPDMIQEKSFSISPEMSRCLAEFHNFKNDLGRLRSMRFDALVQELVSICLESNICDLRTADIHQDDLSAIRQLKEQIDRDPGNVPVIQVLAAQYAMSVSKLTRIFRQEYGSSLHSYVIEKRLCESVRLLASEGLTVGEVAQRVGYAKQSQFSAAFKKRFGLSPRDYC